MKAPFVVGKPVTGKYFIKRKELKKIEALLAGTKDQAINNIVLLGLRRTGKSSILLNVQQKLNKDNKIIPFIYNAEGISTKERFAKSYMSVVLDSYIEKTGNKAIRDRLKKTISQGLDKIKNKISEFDMEIAEYLRFELRFRESKINEDELLEQALQYPEKLGRSKKISFVIMIDEFQELLKWGDEFLKIFRNMVQKQKFVAYVFAGSAPSIMRDMVYDSKSPFYKQLFEVHTLLLSEKDVTDFVKNQFKSVKISAESEATSKIYEFSRGFPDYIQRLGLLIYLECISQNKKKITAKDVGNAYSEMLIQLDPDFTAQFKRLSDLEREILIAISRSRNSVSEIAIEIRTSQTSLPKTLNRLINEDVVEKYMKGKYRLLDPVFSDWVLQRYKAL